MTPATASSAPGASRSIFRWLLEASRAALPTAPGLMGFTAPGRRALGLHHAPGRSGSHPTQAKLPAQRVRLCFARDSAGMWTVAGVSWGRVLQFPNLAEAIAFAREHAGAAEADIEIWADGLYAFVRQPQGWPHRLCAPASARMRDPVEATRRTAFPTSRLMALARSRHDPDNFHKRVLRGSAANRLRAAIAGVLLTAVFIVLAAAALYLRARLGFVH